MTSSSWWRLLSWVFFPLAVLGWLPALPAYLNRGALWLARQLARPYLRVEAEPKWREGRS